MCVPRARLAVAIGIFLPLTAILVENVFFSDSPIVLTPHQIKAYERDGFVVLERVVPLRMVSSLLDELHAVQGAAEANGEADGSSWDEETSGADPVQCTFVLAHDEEGNLLRPASVHKAQGIGLNSSGVLKLLRYPPIASAAAMLVRRGLPPAERGSSKERLEVDAFGTKYFPVRAGTPGSVSWHDDNYYFGTTRSHTISSVTYLRDVDARSACLRVLPGSHRDPEVGSDRARWYKALPQQHGEYVPDELVTHGELANAEDGAPRSPIDVPLSAGSVVLFDANLLHAVHPNREVDAGGLPMSERVAFHYIPGDLDTGFRDTSFARGRFADRHLAMNADGTIPS